MRKYLKFLLASATALISLRGYTQTNAAKLYQEPYRPQIHFSPKAHWMNDPNGMVYYKGTYHLFFQHYPNDIIWGPMHWGHAVSKDLIHWQELPIALYPDKSGYIFSGSAVVDDHNTSGFGKNGQVPLVAVFTHHDPKGEKAGTRTYQNQSIAYSLNEGKTWVKYAGNPVLKNPGIKDFRDPKVMWYAPQKKWVMTLATLDRITFYSSPNLKDWHRDSDFGLKAGAHGGVWECPDLFQLKLNGKNYWVLLVNLNPGGPNGGSGTQYFIGNFNGKTFTPLSIKTRWADYGPDNYAGVTWSNTGDRKIFLGWMSNWLYANQVPTAKWRNATTIPRELMLKQVNGEVSLSSQPVKELATIASKPVDLNAGLAGNNLFDQLNKEHPAQYRLKFNVLQMDDFSVIWSNNKGEKLTLGYKKQTNKFFIARSGSGKVDFNADFKKTAYAPRLSMSGSSEIELVVDRSSIELFADGGSTVMTGIYFAQQGFDHLHIQSKRTMSIKNLQLQALSSIW